MPTTYLAHHLARFRVQQRGSESYWPVWRLIHRPQTKTGSVWPRRQTSKRCTGKPDPSNLYQNEGWWPALAGVETCQWSTTHHLDPPDLSWHGCYSDWGPAASGGQTVLANNRNGGRLRLIASRHYYYYYYYEAISYKAMNNYTIMKTTCSIAVKERNERLTQMATSHFLSDHLLTYPASSLVLHCDCLTT